MKNKIAYFMARDTRLVFGNLTKVIIDEDIVVKYTVFRKNLDELTTTAIRYSKPKNIMIIYDKLRKYNKNVYNSFIGWAKENEIKYIKESEKETISKELDKRERERIERIIDELDNDNDNVIAEKMIYRNKGIIKTMSGKTHIVSKEDWHKYDIGDKYEGD